MFNCSFPQTRATRDRMQEAATADRSSIENPEIRAFFERAQEIDTFVQGRLREFLEKNEAEVGEVEEMGLSCEELSTRATELFSEPSRLEENPQLTETANRIRQYAGSLRSVKVQLDLIIQGNALSHPLEKREIIHIPGKPIQTYSFAQRNVRGSLVIRDVSSPRGEGSFGTVHTGSVFIEKNQELPIFFKAVEAANAAELKNIRKEAAILYALEGHPNIGRIEYCEIDGRAAYFIQEQGDSDLYELIANSHPKIILNPLSFVQQMLEGVSYVNERGFIHRDLKPENFIVKENEEGKPTSLVSNCINS